MAAELIIPAEFEFLAVDGKKIESSLLNRQSKLQLSNGHHNIAIRYNDIIEDDFDDSHEFVTSKPFIIHLLIDGDFIYRLNSDSKLSTEDPKRFAKHPKIVVSRKDNGKIVYRFTQTQLDESSILNGFADSNSQQDIALLAAKATQNNEPQDVTHLQHRKLASTNKKRNQVPKDSIPANIKSAEMLQYWWQQADKKTRKAFLNWAIDNM